MNNGQQFDNKAATKYLLQWMEAVKRERIHNPEAFIKKEPGLYIGGVRAQPGDTIVNDNRGLPVIHRAGTCE